MSTTVPIEPLGNRILYQRAPEEEVTEGRDGVQLFKPDVAKQKPTDGWVVAVGKDVRFLKPGDHILFGVHSGFDIPQGERLGIMREEEVWGRFLEELQA